jgi:hypothetical protein
MRESGRSYRCQSIWYRLGLEAPFAYDKSAVAQEHPDWREPRTEIEPELMNVLIYSASTSVGL